VVLVAAIFPGPGFRNNNVYKIYIKFKNLMFKHLTTRNLAIGVFVIAFR
jgi:hypothetical protein